MGVFARLLRRSKAAEEASPAEVPVGALTAGTDAGSDTGVTKSDTDVAVSATDAVGVAESAERAEEVERAEAPKGSSGNENSENSENTDESDGSDREVEVAVAVTGAAGAASSDDVEIPQQQTAEKAADNGAGESARK